MVNVVVARLGDLANNQVFQIVQDWTVAGLAKPTVWINLEDTSTARLLTDKGLSEVATGAWLANTIGENEEINLFHMQLLRDSKTSTDFDQVLAVISKVPTLRDRLDKLVNLVIPAADIKRVNKNSFFDFRLNLVFAPVSGLSSLTPYQTIDKKSKEFFSHAAGAVVSATGSWYGQENLPLAPLISGRNFGPGSNSAISRYFVRYVDSSGLVRDLVKSISVRPEAGLPVPVDEKGSPFDALNGGAAQAAVVDVAEQFFNENKLHLGFKQPAGFRSGPLQKISFLNAIKLYFSFVFRWLREAPGEWARETIANAKKSIADAGQKFLGTDSQFEVIVQGISARPLDASTEIDLGSEIMEAAKGALGATNIAIPASPNQLWEHMVTIACNLADAGQGGGNYSLPSLQGQKRLVLSDPALLTPNAQTNYFDVPATLPIGMRGIRLRSDDPYSAYVVAEQIEQALQHGQTLDAVKFTELSNLKLALEKWVSENNSFIWLTGKKLALELHRARVYSRDLLVVSQNIDSGIDLAEIERKARKALWNVIKGGLLILGVAGLVWLIQAIVLFVLNKEWPVLAGNAWLPAAIVAAIFVLWNIVGIFTFNSAVAEFFTLEKKIKEQQAKARWAKDIFPVILQELHRLASLYMQYRLWVKVVSPLFYRAAQKTDRSIVAENQISKITDLPKAVSISSLAPEGIDRDNLFEDIKRTFYKSGWLKTTLDSYIANRGYSLASIWNDNASSKTSDLVKLGENSSEDEVTALLSELDGASAKALATQGENYQHWTVMTNGKDFSQKIAGHEFIDSIRKGDTSIPMEDLLNPKAAVIGASTVSAANSYFAIDSRLTPDSDLGNLERIAPAEVDERSLDFMAVRLEVSEVVSQDAFSFLLEDLGTQATSEIDPNRAEG